MPLIRRLPKRGFNNAAFHKRYAVINLDDLNEFKAGTVVNEQLLRESKLVRGNVAGIKILGQGELKHALTIEVDKISASAREKVDKAGGSVALRQPQLRKPERSGEDVDETNGQAVEDAIPEPATKQKSRKRAAAPTGRRSKRAATRKS